MTAHVVIPRADSWEAAGPHWRPHAKPFSVPWEKGERVAVVTCARGHSTDVSTAVHRIDADGAMYPSYVCTAHGCDFHVWARLDGWTP